MEDFTLGVLPMLCFTLVVFVGVAILSVSAIRILPEFQRLVVFRLGRYIRTVGPGIVMLMPMIDRGVKVDLREQSQSLTQVINTSDFLRVSVDFGWRYRVADPAKAVLGGQGTLEAEIREVVDSTLRSTVGALTADQLRFERAAISETVRSRLQSIFEQRGLTITLAEIKEIVRA